MSDLSLQGLTGCLSRWRERHPYTPWYRRYEFLLFSLLLLALYALFVLPAPAASKAGEWPRVVVFFLLVLAWTMNILADSEKPTWIHGLAAVGLLVAGGWLFYQYSGARWDRLGDVYFDMRIMEGQWGLMLEGLVETLRISALTIVLGTCLGLSLAILRSFNNRMVTAYIVAYVNFFRAMPILVLLMFVYYGLPSVSILLDALWAGVLVLSLGNSAYISEIFRAGFNSVAHVQIEASQALGLSRLQTMRLVVLPQAMRVVVPPLTGRWVGILKDTSICATIAIVELLKAAQIVQTWKANPTPLIIAAMIYLAFMLPLTRLSGYLERRMKVARAR